MATRPSPALSYTMRRDEPTRIEGFSDAVSALSSSGSLSLSQGSRTDVTSIMLVYHLGVIALFVIFALLYRHALNKSAALFALLYFTNRNFVGMSGFVYMLMGPAHGVHGARYGKARARLIAERETARV